MMIKLEDIGEPCTLEECEPGPFRQGNSLGFKSEYGRHLYNGARMEWFVSHWPDAYVVESGEYWIGVGIKAGDQEARANQIVQPMRIVHDPSAKDK